MSDEEKAYAQPRRIDLVEMMKALASYRDGLNEAIVAIAAADAEIERLTRERDEARGYPQKEEGGDAR